VIDAQLASGRNLAAAWQAEAERRLQITKNDPVADTLSHCALELLEQLQHLDDDTLYLKADAWADHYGVTQGKKPPTPRTVNCWIRDGRLEAMGPGSEKLIHRDAQPTRLK